MNGHRASAFRARRSTLLSALLRSSSLPNLHPAVVHFPIALLVLAPVLDLAAIALRRRPWVSWLGAVVWVLAALAAGAAYWSGEQAEQDVQVTDAGAMVALEAHAVAALRTLWAASILAAVRLALTIWSVRRPVPGIAAPLVTAVLGPLAIVLVARTADLGGTLVYRHGVGVSAAAEELVPVREAAQPQAAPAP